MFEKPDEYSIGVKRHHHIIDTGGTVDRIHHRKVVLVTGCSSGLGYALAEALDLDSEFRVVLTARPKSIEFLKCRFKENDFRIVRSVDVTDETQIDLLVDEINTRWGGVDILINNAGVCFRAVVEQMDEDSEMLQLKTNYLGPMSLIRAIIPTMREKRSGHIINVSSVSGMMAMPTMSSYSASKAALEAASEALWYEVRGYGISVSVVQPGFIRSASFRNVVLSKKSKLSQDLGGPYNNLYQGMTPFIEKLMTRARSSPHTIAELVIKTARAKNPPLWVPVTRDAKLFGLLKQILPRSIFHKLMFLLLPRETRQIPFRVASSLKANA